MGLSRFELLTPRLSSVCSNQLSYRPLSSSTGTDQADLSKPALYENSVYQTCAYQTCAYQTRIVKRALSNRQRSGLPAEAGKREPGLPAGAAERVGRFSQN